MGSVTNQQAVRSLLLNRHGWVTHEDIMFVGGHEGMRRLREVREELKRAGFVFEQRPGRDGTLEYRVFMEKSEPESFRWRCIGCGASPTSPTQPSMDPRWRLGKCWRCKKNPRGIFEKRAS